MSATDPKADDSEWQDFLSAERVVTKADWNCRRTVYFERIETLLPKLEQFAVDHHQEITEAQAAWDEIEKRAARLGYRGQVGTLDSDASE